MTVQLLNILVPLDGSKFSERAIDTARQLAVDYGATLHCLSVAEGRPEPIERLIGYTWLGYDQRVAKELVELTAYLEAVEAELSAETLPLKTSVIAGDAAARIVHYASTHKIDLIVMATHGRNGATRWALGSVTERVARAAKTAVLLLR